MFGYPLPGIMASVNHSMVTEASLGTDEVGQMCVVSGMIQVWLLIINMHPSQCDQERLHRKS